MSFLTPLYLLGILAVAAPIVFHLIRRTPRGEVPFSSLMFLSPSPPRLTRRSRLDHILLLLLRATALCLLAFAFARPFLREAAQLELSATTERRRPCSDRHQRQHAPRRPLGAGPGRWPTRSIAECRPADELAVLRLRPTDAAGAELRRIGDARPARRQAVARARIDGAGAGWGATDLGQALIDAVAAIEDVADTSEKTGRMPRRIVLISDLQQGSRLEALGDFEWPSDVELELKTVADDWLQRRPATARRAGRGRRGRADPRLRVRVFNDADRSASGSRCTGPRTGGAAVGKPIDVYVPPGESRVVRVPRDKADAAVRAIVLKGDAAPSTTPCISWTNPGKKRPSCSSATISPTIRPASYCWSQDRQSRAWRC